MLTGARELRVKESDRIQVMADGLAILGIDARPVEDGMVIRGGMIRVARSTATETIALQWRLQWQHCGRVKIYLFATVPASVRPFRDLSSLPLPQDWR